MSQINIKKLILENSLGAGLEVYAEIDKPVNCVEFTMKGNYPQKILIATEPWIQFPPKEWEDMLNRVLGEMVNLWNEKHS